MNQEFKLLIRLSGLFYDTYSPGDGITRYRFFPEASDYFANNGLHTCLGIREACIFLSGYVAALEVYHIVKPE